MSRLCGRVLVTGVVAVLAAACQIDNPGFKLMEGASSGGAATTGMTGEGTSGGSTASSAGGTGTGSETGVPGTAGSGAPDTGEGGSEAGTTGAVCVAMAPCYTGPEGSMGVGPCQGGVSSCTALGEFTSCEGEVVPQTDPCATEEDEDCSNGIMGCTGCMPGTIVGCYSGLLGTEAVGLCKGGSATCSTEGVMGACVGEVTPIAEVCDNKLDEDCDGSADNCG